MAINEEQVQQLKERAATIGQIPAHPTLAAKVAQDSLPSEPPVTPPGVETPTAVEEGLQPDAVDFFGNLAASMDDETQTLEPEVLPQQPPGVSPPVEVPPYEPPVHQRQPGEVPESLEPQPTVPSQLEAAIEQPLVEEELRLTAEQWAAAQRASQPTPPEQPAAPPQEQIDPVQLRLNAIENLTKTQYALSTEDAAALIAEPDTVIPRLAAQMHVDVQVGLANQIAQILPGIIQAEITKANRVQTLESSFFGQYPELNKPEFRQTVQESLTLIRQVNPQATREDVMRDGAALAAVRLKTQLGMAQQPGFEPQLSPEPQGAPPTAQAPFAPAQAGGASPPVVPTAPTPNIFEELSHGEW